MFEIWGNAQCGYEYYNVGADGGYSVYGAVWRAQSFTAPAYSHKLTSVKLKLYRVSTPGTLTVSIKATDVNGKPTGADLTSGTLDGNAMTTDTGGAWYTCAMTELLLLNGVKYAVVIRALTGDSTHAVCWVADGTSSTYADGDLEASGDSGATWTAYDGYDYMFEVWGNDNFAVADSGAGTEVLSIEEAITIIDTALGTELVYLLGEVLIDGLQLNHALRIRVSEPTTIASKPVSVGLPTRLYLGGQGRTLEIEGWVATVAELNVLAALADGAVHEIQLPTGDRVSVHIPDVAPARPIEPGEYPYTIRAVERMD
jgi:hypothetical protein